MSTIYSKIKQLLGECNANHQNCSRNLKFGLPRRVIFVGAAMNIDKVRLYETKPDQQDSYIALSHCWGRAHKPSTTTVENIASRLEGIPWEQIPKTFQDAISVARGLGIEYIWIDSLCIIQNSESDWQMESAKMGSIYENATLVLSADKAQDCSEGCFTAPLTPEELLSRKLKLDLGYSLYVRSLLPHVILGDTVNSKITSPYPVASRAWIFQEQLLANRILHFTSNELVWECRTTTICECGRNNKTSVFKQLWHQAFTGTLTESRGLWYPVIEAYSARKLSHQRDVLPALSSAATRIKQLKRENGQYLAGLWAKYLPDALVWWVKDGDGVRPKDYLAPSFSWASVIGAITYGLGETTEPLLEILEASCNEKGANQFGEVVSGFIKLAGPSFEVRLERTNSEERSRQFNRITIQGSTREEGLTTITEFDPFMDSIQELKEALDPSSAPVMYMPCHEYLNTFQEMQSGIRPYSALLLKRSEKDGQYRRIGVAQYVIGHRVPDMEPKEVTVI